MKRTGWRPWSSVIAGGESLISSAGGVLLAQTPAFAGAGVAGGVAAVAAAVGGA